MAKITVDTIKAELDPLGWVLLSSTYKNLDEQLEFKCPEGHQVFNSWKKMRGNPICPQCRDNIYKKTDTKVVQKKGTGVRLLALDQSSHVTGWSIYDGRTLVKFGVYTAGGNSEMERLDSVKNWLVSMIENWKPDHIAIEGIQYEQNFGVIVFQTLARLQGILMECCFENRLQFTICPTNTWRNRVGVKGRARSDRKRSAQMIIKEKYDVSATDDEADAILIGQYAAAELDANNIVEWE